jgi:hypothetical protein
MCDSPRAAVLSRSAVTSACTEQWVRPLVQVADAAEYLDTMRQQRITLGTAERSSAIWDAVSAAASSVGGSVPDSFQTDLLNVSGQAPVRTVTARKRWEAEGGPPSFTAPPNMETFTIPAERMTAWVFAGSDEPGRVTNRYSGIFQLGIPVTPKVRGP